MNFIPKRCCISTLNRNGISVFDLFYVFTPKCEFYSACFIRNVRVTLAGVPKPGQPRRTQDFGNGLSFPLGVRGFESHLLHILLYNKRKQNDLLFNHFYEFYLVLRNLFMQHGSFFFTKSQVTPEAFPRLIIQQIR